MHALPHSHLPGKNQRCLQFPSHSATQSGLVKRVWFVKGPFSVFSTALLTSLIPCIVILISLLMILFIGSKKKTNSDAPTTPAFRSID